ncbi:MAG: exodeoxyribonuclease VII large subunit [Planctomycetota bacterium]|nr:MAG: exodeoxyribonuclease VII large subunit [Planctomycetota bacterium]
MNDDAVMSVGTLTSRISADLEAFGPLMVRGEISQGRVVASGHYYATLKDREAIISLVCWRSTATRLGNKLPKEGDEVVVRGNLSVYGPRGQYQLIATGFRAVGAGDLMARFEELKQQLAGEGLFAEERKRPLPFLPQGIGIATASGSAAEADILDSIGARFPDMMVTVQPCLVQGVGAKESIVAALQALDADPDVEVIILGRGGGSLEDLWAFNEEMVVRAIAACRCPVISAVGHETDITLADFVADARAKTPTAAGEMVVPVQDDLYARIDELREDLDNAIDHLLAQAAAQLAGLSQHRALATPRHQWAVRSQRLDELAERLDELLPRRLEDGRRQLHALARQVASLQPNLALQQARLPELQQRLQRALLQRQRGAEERATALVARLEGLSPLAVIARGYSVITAPSGEVLRRVDQAPLGSSLRARLSDGIIEATVTKHQQRRLQEASELYQPGADNGDPKSP